MIPQVVASERGAAQTAEVATPPRVVGLSHGTAAASGTVWKVRP